MIVCGIEIKPFHLKLKTIVFLILKKKNIMNNEYRLMLSMKIMCKW